MANIIRRDNPTDFQSSSIKEMFFIPEINHIGIKYLSGETIYWFCTKKEFVWTQLLNSSSKGKYINKYLKRNLDFNISNNCSHTDFKTCY